MQSYGNATTRMAGLVVWKNAFMLLKTDRHPFNGLFSRTTWISRHQKG